ncbi:hypothetical protein [Streptomyces bungoensis]|uniref:hypothetical protein n=1 Tax=Streptomyces bungoensis TaxID=285568 RepID=UPI003425B052
MSDRDLSEYERMWTSERDQWALFRSGAGYLPILKGTAPDQHPGQGPFSLLIVRRRWDLNPR